MPYHSPMLCKSPPANAVAVGLRPPLRRPTTRRMGHRIMRRLLSSNVRPVKGTNLGLGMLVRGNVKGWWLLLLSHTWPRRLLSGWCHPGTLIRSLGDSVMAHLFSIIMSQNPRGLTASSGNRKQKPTMAMGFSLSSSRESPRSLGGNVGLSPPGRPVGTSPGRKASSII